MKVAVVVLALLGMSYALPAPTYTLPDDLQDLLDLIPVDKVKELAEKYKNDPDVIALKQYIKSSEFAKVVDIVKHVPEIRQVVDFAESKGIKIIELLNELADRLGLAHWDSYSLVSGHSNRNLRGFLDELIKIMPVDDIEALLLDKLANSHDFQELFDMISSIDANRLHDELLQHPEVRDLISRLNAMGVDTKKVWDLAKTIFGWDTYKMQRSTYNLRNDLNDFLALLPVDKIKALVEKYENDPDAKKLIDYLHSDEFGKVFYILSSAPEAKDIVNFLESKGLKVIELINAIADRLGLPHWTQYTRNRSTLSARQFLDELKALIPVDKLTALAVDKLANSEDFAELFEKISELNGPKLLEQAKTHPEIVNALNFLRGMGVDLDEIWNTLKSIFGWE